MLTRQIYRDCVDNINYSTLAVTYRQTLRNYVERGCQPGAALKLALEGSLEAILLFDDPVALEAVARWINNELPPPVWGSPEKVRAWEALARRQARSQAGA